MSGSISDYDSRSSPLAAGIHKHSNAVLSSRRRPWLESDGSSAAATGALAISLPPTKRFVYVPVSHPLFHSLSALRHPSPHFGQEPPSKRSKTSDLIGQEHHPAGRDVSAEATQTGRTQGPSESAAAETDSQSKTSPHKQTDASNKTSDPMRRSLERIVSADLSKHKGATQLKRLSMWAVDVDDMSNTSSAPPAADRESSPGAVGARPSANAPAQAEQPRSQYLHPSLKTPHNTKSIVRDPASTHTPVSRGTNSAAGTPESASGISKSDSIATSNVQLKSGGEIRKKKKTKPRKDHRYLSKQALLPAIDSETVICADLRPYAFLGDESRRIGDDLNIESITLEYPGDNAREIFPLVIPARNHQGEYNPINDIYVTTQAIARYCLKESHERFLGDSKTGTIRSIMKACHRRDPSALQSAISDFNQVITHLREEGSFEQDEIRGPPAPYEFVTHILEQAYARSVAPYSHMLNNYQGFSNNVYGEIKQSFVHDLIKQADIQPHHIFLDMGSGIGNVVLQVAAECLCESYGIEIMETPANFAKKQRAEFLSRMRYYAKPCGRIVLRQGDFLEDDEIHEVIARADVIFVNNYAFDAALNQGILAKFLDLKESAKVISLRSFVPVDRRPNLRRSNAIESIFRVKEYLFARDSVSWMVEGGSYYIHTVDRSQLASVGI